MEDATRIVLGTLLNADGTPSTDCGLLQSAGSTVLLISGRAHNMRYPASIELYPGATLGSGTVKASGILTVTGAKMILGTDATAGCQLYYDSVHKALKAHANGKTFVIHQF